MSYLERIAEANSADLREFRPFVVDGETLGAVSERFAAELAHWRETFSVSEADVRLAPSLQSAAEARRTREVAAVTAALRDRGLITGWRDELYAVSRRWGDRPRLLLERAAVPLFGVPGYGVHMNGYCEGARGLELWVGRRARNKPTDPGKLDQLVAGGQPARYGLLENLVKECAEEAGIPAELARQARAAGVVTYAYGVEHRYRPDVLFVFDLLLPADFEPRNTDCEVEAFFRLPVLEVAERVATTRTFKFNCALVVIDFLVRHGVIPPEHPDYVEIVGRLRAQRPLPPARDR